MTHRVCLCYLFIFKQKTAYEMRISDWSSDVCSSDLADIRHITATSNNAPAMESPAPVAPRMATAPMVIAPELTTLLAATVRAVSLLFTVVVRKDRKSVV